MPIVVFDISPGEVVVIQNAEEAVLPERKANNVPLPELGLQVVEHEAEE